MEILVSIVSEEKEDKRDQKSVFIILLLSSPEGTVFL